MQIIDRKTPFKGVGTGRVSFAVTDPDFLASQFGVDTDYILDIELNMDDASHEQAKAMSEAAKKDPKKGGDFFLTRFLLSRDGDYKIVSVLSKEIKSNAERVGDYDPLNSLTSVITPFTPSKAEFAGMALNYLIGRAKAVNTPADSANNLNSSKP